MFIESFGDHALEDFALLGKASLPSLFVSEGLENLRRDSILFLLWPLEYLLPSLFQ